MTTTEPRQDLDPFYWLHQLTTDAAGLARCVPDDNQLADAIGDLRALEVKLADIRHGWERAAAELDTALEPAKDRRVNPDERAGRPVAQGDRWELVPNWKTTRTYNTPAILSAVATSQNVDLFAALMLAVRLDAVRLTWRWTQLKALCQRYGISLLVGHGDTVSDDTGLDGPMVGEVRVQSGFKRVPLKEGK